MKILITGGAGFVGSNFIYWLLKNDSKAVITCFDLLTYAGNLETLNGAIQNERFSFVRGDITDKEAVYRLIGNGNFDAVVNFAAESHVDRSLEDPGLFLVTNIIGAQVLMDACREYGVKRFHQVSTDEVYGFLPPGSEDLFFTEDTPLSPSSPYSASKASADLLAMAYHRTYGFPVTISRCSNNYGPYQFPEKLIPLMIYRALNNESLPVYGNGENVRDWLHVSDHCRAVYMILQNGKPGEIYNVGGHSEKQNIDVVKTILLELDKPMSLIKFVKDRPGHDYRYAINPEKMETTLDWKPLISFEDGIRETIKWYLDNENWWRGIINGEYRHYYQRMYGDRK